MGWLQGQQLKGHQSKLQYLHIHPGETHQELALQEGQFAIRGGTCPREPCPLWEVGSEEEASLLPEALRGAGDPPRGTW